MILGETAAALNFRGYPVLERAVTIPNKWGLHARAAWQLADLSNRFCSEITIENGNHRGNAKNILEILLLAAEMGSQVMVRVQGEDEDKALSEVVQLIENGFYES